MCFSKKISFISCSYIQVTVISSVSLSQSVFSKMYDSKVYFQNVFCFILLQKLQLHLSYSYRRCLIVLPATLHSLHSLSLEAAHPVQRGDCCSATKVAPSAMRKTGAAQCSAVQREITVRARERLMVGAAACTALQLQLKCIVAEIHCG